MDNSFDAVFFIDEQRPSLEGDDVVIELDGPDSLSAEFASDNEDGQEGYPKVYYVKRENVKNLNGNDDITYCDFTKYCVELKKAYQGIQRTTEPKGNVYVCCHFGGGGETDAYKRTAMLNSNLKMLGEEQCFVLAISRGNSFPVWAYQTINRQEIIEQVQESIVFAQDEWARMIVGVDNIISSLNTFVLQAEDDHETDNCAIVVGCACGTDKLEVLYRILCEKCGQAKVFIVSQEGIFKSSWSGWSGTPLSCECVSRFHQAFPTTKIFALSTVPYTDDLTNRHELFTDWMFAGWINRFGAESVRFYGKDENDVQTMMCDLHRGKFSSGKTMQAKDCHLEDWHKYLMFRMKH